MALHLLCPLTWLEGWARQRAGEAVPTRGFIDRYIEGVLYPSRLTPLFQGVALLAVVVGYAGLLRRRRRVPIGDPGAGPAPHAGGSTSKAGCLAAIARIWSSVESGPTPSKKTPTSTFHRFR